MSTPEELARLGQWQRRVIALEGGELPDPWTIDSAGLRGPKFTVMDAAGLQDTVLRSLLIDDLGSTTLIAQPTDDENANYGVVLLGGSDITDAALKSYLFDLYNTKGLYGLFAVIGQAIHGGALVIGSSIDEFVAIKGDGTFSGAPVTAALGVKFPSADPHKAGSWWDNAGTLTKSAG